MDDAIVKYKLQTRNLGKNQRSSPELQLDSSGHISLSAGNGLELSTLSGNIKVEELEGLSMEELHQMEKEYEADLTWVLQAKGERLMAEINDLHKKSAGLIEQNIQLKQKVALICEGKVPELDNTVVYNEDGQSSESNITHVSKGIPSAEEYFSDTSLKLGPAAT